MQVKHRLHYLETEREHFDNQSSGKYNAIPNNGVFTSAYHFYNQSDDDGPRSREATHPLFTQYADDLKGTFDHIMFASDENSAKLELLELLEVPNEKVLA